VDQQANNQEVVMRKLFRRLAMAVLGVAPAAVVVVYATAAEASNCGQPCFSDRRLKKNIQPI
jgi:hypothetical protein